MIKSWALSVCSAGIAVAVLQMIIPQMKLKSMINMVLSLLLLLAIASPLIGTGSAEMPLIYTPVPEEILNQNAGDLTVEAVRLSLQAETAKIMSGMGIKTKAVRIDIDVTGSAYNIAAITVYLAGEDEDHQDEILARLREAFGQAVYISYDEGDMQ